jgi:hypothetical protein
MTTTVLAPYLTSQFFTNNGQPNASGLVYTYQGGTNTPTPTWTDSTGGQQNTNPIVLNARGECSIWVTPNVAYKFVLTDAAGNTIWTRDQVVQNQLITLYGGVDTGAVNAYVLNFVANFSSLTDGIVIYWIPAHNNTGASTINVNGLGPVNIVRPDGTPVTANNILANQVTTIMFKGGVFQLVNAGNIAPSYGGTSTNSGNNYSLTYSSSFGQYNDGIIIYWVPNATNSGASTLNVNGLGALPIVYTDGSALQSGTLTANVVVTVVIIASKFILLTAGVASFTSGTFTPTWTGFSAPPTGSALWSKVGNTVSLTFITNGTGTSNTTGMTITNLPAAIQPSTGGGTRVLVIVTDNGTEKAGGISFGSAGVMNFLIGTAPPSLTGFTNTGTKGMAFGASIIYPLV